MVKKQNRQQRTNDRRYESKDSREIENCSISTELSDDSRDEICLRGHWPFSSEGEG
jgi:hypothetical protein